MKRTLGILIIWPVILISGSLYGQDLSISREELGEIWRDCHQCLTCIDEIKEQKIKDCKLELNSRQLAGKESACSASAYANCNTIGSYLENKRVPDDLRELYADDCIRKNQDLVQKCVNDLRKKNGCEIGLTEDRCLSTYQEECNFRYRRSCLNKYQNLPKPEKYFQVACRQGKISSSCENIQNRVDFSGVGNFFTSCYRIFQDNFLIWFAYAMMGMAIYLISKIIFIDERQFKAAEKLEEGVVKEDFSKLSIILKYSRPFFKRYVSQIVAGMKNKRQIKEKYTRPLATAGLNEYLTPEDFYAYKLFLVLGFPVAFLFFRYFLETDWPLSYIPFVAVFGYFYPDLWMQGKIKQRQEDMIVAMPFCVDMLALSVEAGLDFVAAMARVIQKAKPSPLTAEFTQLIKEISIGASRAEALRNMAWRSNLIQISSFTATLIAADQVGADIAPILKALSVEIRQKRSALAEIKGKQVSTTILFPMIGFIVPACLVAIMAPVVLSFMGAD